MNAIKYHTTYTYEHDEHVFPLPFDPESEPYRVTISPDGLTAELIFIIRDDSPFDPIEEHDEGEFYQFNGRYIHYAPRPDMEDFKRLIRYHGGLCLVDCYGDRYDIGRFVHPWQLGRAYRAACPKEYDRIIDAIESADGYYITPDDVTNPVTYGKGVMQSYSAFCTGDVYGICHWTYSRDNVMDPWPDPERDDEVWGYYGYDSACQEVI